MAHCETSDCTGTAAAYGSGSYHSTTRCLGCFAAWYQATVQAQDRERLAVLPTVPAGLALNAKQGEGICRWCQEPIYWRRRADGGKPYPAVASGDTDAGHRCPGMPDRGGSLVALAALVGVLLLAAWAPLEAQEGILCPCTPAPVYGPWTGMDATGRPIHMVPGGAR